MDLDLLLEEPLNNANALWSHKLKLVCFYLSGSWHVVGLINILLPCKLHFFDYTLYLAAVTEITILESDIIFFLSSMKCLVPMLGNNAWQHLSVLFPV